MNHTRSGRTGEERLRASPNFTLAHAFDGRPYVAKDTEPYEQYWLSERDRLLLAMFSGRRGATVDEAIAGCLRLVRAPRDATARRRLLRSIEDLRGAGVILSTRDDTSRYTARIVESYVAHRPFPRELAQRIVAAGPVRRDSAVLDLAGGPGDLALALARASANVSMLELSRGFLGAAVRRARAQGLALTPILDSCNRLVHRDERYDVVTISQALHWMDDVMVCRGLCRCLRPDGSFFVVHGGFDVDDAHPLSHLFGERSILGARPAQSFGEQADALLRRLALLFEALDAPDVHRVDPTQHRPADGAHAPRIVAKSATLFRQRRPFDTGFARAFLTPRHVEVTGLAPDVFWKDVEMRCAGVAPRELVGTYHWALLHFRRDGAAGRIAPLERARAVPIGFRAQDAVAPKRR